MTSDWFSLYEKLVPTCKHPLKILLILMSHEYNRWNFILIWNENFLGKYCSMWTELHGRSIPMAENTCWRRYVHFKMTIMSLSYLNPCNAEVSNLGHIFQIWNKMTSTNGLSVNREDSVPEEDSSSFIYQELYSQNKR